MDLSDRKEIKNGLSYLSWAFAWGEVKKRYPKSFYTIYETPEGCLYHTDGKTAWVKTGVTIVDGDEQQEYIEYLPVMNMRNQSIMIDNITSTDVNKAIQRSITKAIARHGLGLYIYAGEDVPESTKQRLAELREDIGKELARCIRKGTNNPMTQNEMMQFKKDHMDTFISQGSYTACTDEDKLELLLEHLKQL